MKKKIGTILDEDLVIKAKQVALCHHQSLSQLFEEALRMYLLTVELDVDTQKRNISQNTRGVMPISRSDLESIMQEEGIYETLNTLRGSSGSLSSLCDRGDLRRI